MAPLEEVPGRVRRKALHEMVRLKAPPWNGRHYDEGIVVVGHYIFAFGPFSLFPPMGFSSNILGINSHVEHFYEERFQVQKG